MLDSNHINGHASLEACLISNVVLDYNPESIAQKSMEVVSAGISPPHHAQHHAQQGSVFLNDIRCQINGPQGPPAVEEIGHVLHHAKRDHEKGELHGGDDGAMQPVVNPRSHGEDRLAEDITPYGEQQTCA